MNKISALLAGRAAEQLVFKEITTGAKDDLDKATNIAKEMVCSYGMSPLGPMALDEHHIKYNYNMVREEIKKILDTGYKNALKILEDNLDILNHISEILLEKETINSDELEEIFKIYKKTYGLCHIKRRPFIILAFFFCESNRFIFLFSTSSNTLSTNSSSLN